MPNDIRWLQRLDSYERALAQLGSAVQLSGERALSDLERQGVVQAFEFTHELAWKTMKDFLEFRGASEIFGSKDAVRGAFSSGLLRDGDVWMRMIAARNLSSHTYNRETVEVLFRDIISDFFPAFGLLAMRLRELAETEES